MPLWGSSLLLSFCWDVLALVLFYTTVSAMAQWPSCTVFMVTSTWAVLLVQLMGPVKLNPTSLAFPKRSPFLSDHHPKNSIVSPGARTTGLVIHSSRPSWNISAINEPLHTWEGGGWLPPPPPKSLWCGCNSMSILHVHGDLINTQALEIIQRAIGWIAWIGRVSWKGHPSVIFLSSKKSISSLRSWTALPVSPASPLWDKGVGEVPPLVAFLCFPIGIQNSYAYVISLLIPNSLDNPNVTLGAMA